jgi:hypothetical protein
VGAEADNTLVHELWHAQRASNSFTKADKEPVDVIDHLPWLNLDRLDPLSDAQIKAHPDFLDRFLAFHQRGDLSSIIVENMYASEKHPGGSYLGGLERRPWYPIRADHEGYRALRNPGALIRHPVVRREIRKLLREQTTLILMLSMARGDFNPFRDYLIESMEQWVRGKISLGPGTGGLPGRAAAG